ncbi:MAG: hypothetical protein ACRDGA_10430 [Bacteroidota bacterium]
MLYEIKNYISLEKCEDQWLYRIASRNLRAGVFRKDRNGFVGIREKFGQEFLFVEFHWDTGEPLGTVKPLQQLELCPIENLDEDLRDEDGALETNRPLFDWLMAKELEYIGPRPEKSKSRREIFGGK